ncbi:MAG: 3-dehydroquinate synthase [Verrucomicrobia bacterium]|nr:3-dehydroquinate synthase [Verrucomicrobiota bacterium]
MGIVTIELGPRSYSVHVGEGLLDEAGRICRAARLTGRAAVVSDRKVDDLYGGRVSNALAKEGIKVSNHLVDPGELSKSFEVAASLCEDFARHGVDRHSFVLALGGGVVGDLAGFAAAVYYRGVPVVQVPTTIMAQVDSSVGGKTGINLSAGKNLVGAFHQPVAVIADTTTLGTLGRREWNEGFAEVIKYGVIREKALLSDLQSGTFDLPELVRRCVEIKASFVQEDERETTGTRALLNFGHTIGHAIEAVAGYGSLLHGEAVALGMVAAAQVSAKRAGLPKEELEELVRAIRRFDLPTELPDRLSRSQILERIFSDKKFVNGKIRFVVTPGLGNALLADNVTMDDLEFGLSALDPSPR